MLVAGFRMLESYELPLTFTVPGVLVTVAGLVVGAIGLVNIAAGASGESAIHIIGGAVLVVAGFAVLAAAGYLYFLRHAPLPVALGVTAIGWIGLGGGIKLIDDA